MAKSQSLGSRAARNFKLKAEKEKEMKYGDLTWGQTEALINKLGGEEVVRDILADKVKLTITGRAVTKILVLVGTITVPGADTFRADDHFTVDTSRKAIVKIAFIWDNFKAHFVPKVEKNIPLGELKAHRLTQSSVDDPMITELGERHETHLSDLWAALCKQPKGEVGTLLTNGYANIFYIRDVDGKLWAVLALWLADHDGWVLYAGSVEDTRRWNAGYQVFSR